MLARPARPSRSSPASGRWATGADVRRERDVPWWPEVLVAQGFAYDSRPSDTLVIPERVAVTPGPRTLARRRLWEFPIAQLAGWQPVRVPIGGASYWSPTPTPGLGHQTPHSRSDANVARLNDRRASRGNRACRDASAFASAPPLIGRCLWRPSTRRAAPTPACAWPRAESWGHRPRSSAIRSCAAWTCGTKCPDRCRSSAALSGHLRSIRIPGRGVAVCRTLFVK